MKEAPICPKFVASHPLLECILSTQADLEAWHCTSAGDIGCLPFYLYQAMQHVRGVQGLITRRNQESVGKKQDEGNDGGSDSQIQRH